MSNSDGRPRVWVGHVTLLSPDLPATRDFMIQLGMRPIEDGDGFAILELKRRFSYCPASLNRTKRSKDLELAPMII